MVILFQLFWHPVWCMKVWNNGRFYWNVLHRICSCYYCLAVNWQATVLAMGFAFLSVCWSSVLVSGCSDFAAGCTAGHLSLGMLWWQPWQSAWAGRCPGQSVLLCCSTGQAGTPMWPWVQENVEESTVEHRTSSSHGGSHARAAGCPKAHVIPSEPCSWVGFWHDLWTLGRPPLWSSSWSTAACVGRTHTGDVEGTQLLFWVLIEDLTWVFVFS